MKKVLLFILLTCLSAPLFAQNGIFWSHERSGEGLLQFANVFGVASYVFTYGGHECEYDVETLEPKDCDLNGARWFFGQNKYDEIRDEIRGDLYITHGVNYPEGIQSEEDPFVQIVGATVAVGEYRLTPIDNGWIMEVVHTDGSPLDKDDPLFDGFLFGDLLFGID